MIDLRELRREFRYWRLSRYRPRWERKLHYKLYRLKRGRQYWLRMLGMRLWRKDGIKFWNWDKPYRCPDCHAIVDDGLKRTDWNTGRALYECCRCGIRFARWPRLAYKVRVCKDIATGRCPNQGEGGLIP